MLVYVDRDSRLYHYLVEIDKGSHLRQRAIEVPDELVVRYAKASLAYEAVQELLAEIWDRENA